MALPAQLITVLGGALVVAVGNVAGSLIEPILGFLALRGLQLLAKVTGSSELQSLYTQAVATYNARGGSYVDKAAQVATAPTPQLPIDPPVDSADR